MKVLVIRIGEVDRETMDHVAGAVRQTFACEIEARGSIPAPPRTYNPGRKQYNSTKVLQALEGLKRSRNGFLLGIIDEDLYVPELNFVFGQADMLARTAVIALPRLRPEFYGFEPDRELFLLRAVKEAIHELGHTSRLDHCPNVRCVMHFSNSLEDTDVKQPYFCTRCMSILKRNK